MTTMGKPITPSKIKSRNYNGKQNKLFFVTIHIEGIKIATFQPTYGYFKKITSLINQQANVFHLATYL